MTDGLSLLQPDWGEEEENCCPCCGAVLPAGVQGCTCPVCQWALDLSLADENTPSAENDGMSLYEARLNFQAFGIALPQLIWTEEQEETE